MYWDKDEDADTDKRRDARPRITIINGNLVCFFFFFGAEHCKRTFFRIPTIQPNWVLIFKQDTDRIWSRTVEYLLMENVFCGHSLGLIWCDMCGDGIGQRGKRHEIDHGYLWILVVMDLNPVASVTVLLTETWYLVDLTADVWTLTERAHAVLWFE